MVSSIVCKAMFIASTFFFLPCSLLCCIPLEYSLCYS
jgi:hypothetical protein